MDERPKAPRKRPRGRPAGTGTSVETRGRIVDAAVSCFAERGYAQAGNREIARRAGVTNTLLYHYFDSKAALFWDALLEVTARLVAIYRESCEAAPDAPSMRQLSLGLERVIELSRERPEIMRFAANAEGEIARHPELAAHHARDSEAFPALFRDLVQRARRRGELAAAVDVESAVKVLQACFTALAFMQGSAKDAEEFAMALRTFEHMLMGNFMLRPGSASQPIRSPRTAPRKAARKAPGRALRRASGARRL